MVQVKAQVKPSLGVADREGVKPMHPTSSARSVALDLIGSVLRRKQPLDDAIEDHAGMAALDARDRAFARLLAVTVLRRLGQIDALIAHYVKSPLPPRAAVVHDMLRLGIAQLLFLQIPAHAAVATTVDLAEAYGFLSHKGLINAVLRRLCIEGPALVEAQNAARLNTPDRLRQACPRASAELGSGAVAAAHLAAAPLDHAVRRDPRRSLPASRSKSSGAGSVEEKLTQLPGRDPLPAEALDR